MQEATRAVEAAVNVPLANGGIENQPETVVTQAVQTLEALTATARQKVKQAQEFIMKKLQECSRVQTPSFAKLKASLPKKLSALAQAEPRLNKAKADVKKAADEVQLQKSMEELKSKFAEIESKGQEVEQQAQSVLDYVYLKSGK